MKAKVVKVNKKGSNKVAFNMEDGSKIKVKIGGKKYRRIVASYEFTEEAKAQLDSIEEAKAQSGVSNATDKSASKTELMEKPGVSGADEPVLILKDNTWVITRFGSEEFMDLVKGYELGAEDECRSMRTVYCDCYPGGVERYVGDEDNPKYVCFGNIRYGFIVVCFESEPKAVVIYQGYAFNYIKGHCRLYEKLDWVEEMEKHAGLSDHKLEGHLEEFKEGGVIVDVSLGKPPTGEGGFYLYETYSAIFQTENGETVRVALMGKACDYIMKNCKFSPEARAKLSDIEEFSRICFMKIKLKA